MTNDDLGAVSDQNYTWNEWDLRREALQLSKLSERRTHSSQTMETFRKRENHAQVRPRRDEATQTGTSEDVAKRKKSIVISLKSADKVDHVLLEELISRI